MSAQSGDGRRDQGEDVKANKVSRSYKTSSGSSDHRSNEASGGVRPRVVIDDQQWYVEEYMKRHPDGPDCHHFNAVVIAELSPPIFDQYFTKHETFFDAWRRGYGTIKRGRAVLLATLIHADMLFVSCEVEVGNCRRLHTFVADLHGLDLMDVLDLEL